MSRGEQQITRNLTDQQLAQQNQAISQEGQSDTQDRSLLMPTIQSLLNSQDYTPQQQSAITQQSLGASNTAFDAWREKAANRTAVTKNCVTGFEYSTTPDGGITVVKIGVAPNPATTTASGSASVSAQFTQCAPVRRRSLLGPHHGPRSQRKRSLFCRSGLSVRTAHAGVAIQSGDLGRVMESTQSVRGGVSELA